jgi:hypothetical protein
MSGNEAPWIMSHRLPSPQVVADQPHLSVLAVLDTALHASVDALIAAHPEMLSTESLVEEALDAPASWLALSLVVQLQAVEAALGHYRVALGRGRAVGPSQDGDF